MKQTKQARGGLNLGVALALMIATSTPMAALADDIQPLPYGAVYVSAPGLKVGTLGLFGELPTCQVTDPESALSCVKDLPVKNFTGAPTGQPGWEGPVIFSNNECSTKTNGESGFAGPCMRQFRVSPATDTTYPNHLVVSWYSYVPSLAKHAIDNHQCKDDGSGYPCMNIAMLLVSLILPPG
jgi:hypothetical protein